MANGDGLKLVLTIGVALLVLYLLNVMASKKSEQFSIDEQNALHAPVEQYHHQQEAQFDLPPTCPQPESSQCEQDLLYQDPALQQLRQASCFPRSQLSPEELLPQDNCSLWAQVNPQGSGSLKDRNFLQAGWATGISTVGSTLRNANRQLRSEPPNPQVKVSPWLQSTIEPDIARKPLEIGGCA